MLPSASSSHRIVRALLVTIGFLLLGYAISDHPLYGGEPGFGKMQGLIAAAGVGIALCALLPAAAAGNALLATLVSVISLLCLEIVGEFILGPRHRPIFQFDEQLIFKFVPNRTSVMTHAPVNGGATVAHRINSQGFRGAELRPSGEAPRVVVYGDSFIHALYATDEETFPVQLSNALRAQSGRSFEVLNAGVSSYGPDQIALKMRGELASLRPDLVVVAIFAGNDYGDLLRNKIFRLGADGRLVENRWRLDPSVRLWLDLSQKESILKRAVRSSLGPRGVPAQAPAEITSAKFLLAEAEREYRSFVVERDDLVTNTHVDYYSADISLTPDSASARYKVALMRAVLGLISETAARQGVPLAFLFIPHPADVSDSDAWGLRDRRNFPRYDGRNLTAPLEESARALNVPFVNLQPLFSAHDVAGLYLGGYDDHWNAAGQKLAAEAMAEMLHRYGLPRNQAGTPRASETADAPSRPLPLR